MIVGLGNPGDKYKDTRHNTGFLVIEKLAAYHSIKIREESRLYLSGKGKIAGNDVMLAMPMTYMNRSGDGVRELMRYYRLSPSDLILIYDDLDLDSGQMRIKTKGGSGGHNGCASVIAAIGTEEFIRIRIGIGRPAAGADITGYVLSKFSGTETHVIELALENAADAVRMIVAGDLVGVMNKYN